jgi:transcriptional regulator with XRE-family HTH domain
MEVYMSTTTHDSQRSLGAAVRSRRVRLKLSQDGVGERAGLHRNYVGALERGEINPTFATLAHVADGLGTTPSALLRAGEARLAAATFSGADDSLRSNAAGLAVAAFETTHQRFLDALRARGATTVADRLSAARRGQEVLAIAEAAYDIAPDDDIHALLLALLVVLATWPSHAPRRR